MLLCVAFFLSLLMQVCFFLFINCFCCLSKKYVEITSIIILFVFIFYCSVNVIVLKLVFHSSIVTLLFFLFTLFNLNTLISHPHIFFFILYELFLSLPFCSFYFLFFFSFLVFFFYFSFFSSLLLFFFFTFLFWSFLF